MNLLDTQSLVIVNDKTLASSLVVIAIIRYKDIILAFLKNINSIELQVFRINEDRSDDFIVHSNSQFRCIHKAPTVYIHQHFVSASFHRDVLWKDRVHLKVIVVSEFNPCLGLIDIIVES